jgi:hypothetical protein
MHVASTFQLAARSRHMTCLQLQALGVAVARVDGLKATGAGLVRGVVLGVLEDIGKLDAACTGKPPACVQTGSSSTSALEHWQVDTLAEVSVHGAANASAPATRASIWAWVPLAISIHLMVNLQASSRGKGCHSEL